MRQHWTECLPEAGERLRQIGASIRMRHSAITDLEAEIARHRDAIQQSELLADVEARIGWTAGEIEAAKTSAIKST